MPEKITLNESQKKAVEFKDGPLLVVAGAGTGKTRVIAQRIRGLIGKKVSPLEILALTFTEKSSEEMLNRIDDVMPLGYEEPWVYTFHSFADRILRTEALEVGLDPAYKIIGGSEQWLLFRQHIFEFDLKYFRPLGNPTKFISAILKFISRLQDENIPPKEFSDFARKFKGDDEDKKRWEELAGAYEKYQEVKTAKSKMDFGDLIVWTIRLFRERPTILKKYQAQFKHVLVDEFQDTNYAQYELIRLLCPAEGLEDRSLLVVGDDSQSIYKFRGAAISNILEFKKDYPEAQTVTMLQNYRSPQTLLDPAYKLITNNNPDTLEAKLKISKKLESAVSKKGEKPKVYQLETMEDEVEFVILEILKILAKEEYYTYKDFAILARANSHLDPFVFGLRKYGLPYQLVGNRGLYDREEVRDVLALLKVVVDPTDGMSMYRVLNINTLKVPPEIISEILSEARKKKADLWGIMGEYRDPAVEKLCEKIVLFQDEITKIGPSEFLYRLVSSVGYVNQFLGEETVENQLCVRNLDLFLEKAKKFEVDYHRENKEIPTIVNFVDFVDLMIEAGDDPAQAEIEDIDTVNLLTVHSSKGLEFPVVFMVNLVGGRFPTKNRGDPIEMPDDLVKETLPSGDFHIQEERRLFYVGMTRAQKYLYLTYANDYGGKRELRPSGFLQETGCENVAVEAKETKEATSQVGLFGVESGFRKPKAEKIKDFDPKHLSYSQVDSYKICPLQYKYSYVLNVPTPPKHALSFGITIHDTLRDFHTALMFGDKVTVDNLLAMYEKNWQPLGYMDEEHRQMRFEEGKKLLRRYFEKYVGEELRPLALEKSFNIKIGGKRFFGRIDRIDPLLGGGVEIVDYKTGAAKDQKFVDKDDQVAFYAIAAKEALGMEPKKLTYFYVESNEKVSTERTNEQMQKTKKEVVEVIKKIKDGQFGATPGTHCTWCDFKDICPFAKKS